MFPGTGNITYHSTLTETIAFRFNLICAVTYVSVCQGSAFAGNQLRYSHYPFHLGLLQKGKSDLDFNHFGKGGPLNYDIFTNNLTLMCQALETWCIMN